MDTQDITTSCVIVKYRNFTDQVCQISLLRSWVCSDPIWSPSGSFWRVNTMLYLHKALSRNKTPRSSVETKSKGDYLEILKGALLRHFDPPNPQTDIRHQFSPPLTHVSGFRSCLSIQNPSQMCCNSTKTIIILIIFTNIIGSLHFQSQRLIAPDMYN